MRKALLILFMLLIILPLSAEGGRMIKLSDTLYEDMEDLYLLNGLSGLSSSRPWSESEVKMMLSRLDYDALNPLSRTLFDSIRGKLQEKKYYLAPHVSISPEIYYHTDGEHFRRDTYWHYGFNERNPFVLASIEAGLGPFYTYSELAFGYGRVTGYDTFIKTGDIEDWCGIGAVVPEEDGSLELLDKSVPYSSAFLFNFPKLTMLEIDIPRRTSFTFAFDDMTFGFLRDKLSWGRSKIGNFIFDDHVSRMDYLFLKLYYKRFGFDYVIYLPEVDYSSMNSNLYEGRNRVMLAHMLSFRILDNLSMAVSENVMYSFRTGEFFQFNPAMIFHDLNNSETLNAIAYLELEYVPIRGLRIYTQFALDQATIITEKNTQPPAFGISLSTEYAMKLGDGILSFFAEGAYTSPYLYRRENVDFIVFNRHSTNVKYRRIPIFTYIGFPYGGDSIAAYGEVSYRIPDSISLALSCMYLAHGEVTMLSTHSSTGNNDSPPDIHSTTPTGNVSHHAVISLDARYPYSFSIFTLEGFVNIAYIYDDGYHDFQLAVGASISI